MLRLIGIPAVAILGVFLYRGMRDRLMLPECDSDNARQTLATLLKELQLGPVRDEPIKTVSASKDEVACSVTLSLPGGGTTAIDYAFYWQDGKIRMKWNTRKS